MLSLNQATCAKPKQVCRKDSNPVNFSNMQLYELQQRMRAHSSERELTIDHSCHSRVYVRLTFPWDLSPCGRITSTQWLTITVDCGQFAARKAKSNLLSWKEKCRVVKSDTTSPHVSCNR